MTHPRRNLGLLLTLAALAAPAQANDVQDAFNQGVELLQSGDREGALAQFQAALAADPSSEEAYELWKNTEHQVWLDMLVAGGEFELIAKRFMEKVRTERAERSNDPDAINELVRTLETNDDVIERLRVTRELSANHGGFAVPRLLQMLARNDGTDTSVIGMVTLAKMDSSVVLPLVEALHADDSFLQMNVAHTLGRIGDRRAAGALAELAAGGADKVAQAAATAAEKCGAAGRAATELYLEEGSMYYSRDPRVLAPYETSSVVWTWRDGALESDPVPGAILAETLAKRAYTRALSTEPQSIQALAGLARAASTIESKLGSLEDVDPDLLESAARGNLAVSVAGAEALDAALGDALAQSPQDVLAGVALCRNLAHLATSATANLRQAASMGSGPLKAEAAIALAHIAAQNGGSPSADVVSLLADSVARQVMRVVVVIDSTERGDSLRASLEGEGVTVILKDRAAAGLAMLRQLPGVDAVLVGDGLADLTLDQTIDEIGTMDHLSQAALFVVSSNDASEGYADRDRVQSVLDGSDLSEVQDVFAQDLTGDRAEADDLSRRAAEALAAVAARGGDISVALDSLAMVAAERENDAVTLPAMHALGMGGDAGQVTQLVGVLADGARSDEARVAAAGALNGIFGRESVQVGDAAGLRDVVVDGSASLAVRQAASRALGRAQVDAGERASIVDEVDSGR